MDDLILKICMSFLLVAVLCLSLDSLKKKEKQHDGIAAVHPPGSAGWAQIVGENIDFLRKNMKGIPEQFFQDRIRKYYSEVFKTSLYGENVTVFSGAAGNKFLFSNEYKLVKMWWPKSVRKIVPFIEDAASPAAQRVSRNLRSKLFPLIMKLDMLRRYVGVMDSLARKHFDAYWDNKEEVVVYPLIQIYDFSSACLLFLSINDEARVDVLLKLFNVVSDGILTIPINLPGTPLYRGIKVSEIIRKEFAKIIKQRMDEMHLFKEDELMEKMMNELSPSASVLPAQDLLSQMILFCKENDDTEHVEGICADIENNNKKTKTFIYPKYLADLVLPIIIAGYHTQSTVITVLIKYLVELPHVLHEVFREQNEIANAKATGELLNLDDTQKMKYSWNVICEVLRLAPPLQGAFTEASADFTYAGYFIPRGWKLYWSAISTHKNPEYFPDPEKFDPSRFQGNGPAPYTFVAFGGGPGMCPGREYARVQMLMFQHHVVRRYEWEKLIPGDEKLKVCPFPLPAKGQPIRLLPRKI
ncbi:beta-amyrin 28-monooxygenase-like [Papaver somniferum]|uniref:beta-amyrin 28-monooxygenase-like n=1 Tax=Papaver somniferum TaxID=3469 RepID=UPI000E704073|nr:beta-amyrin 28-monooxygenase-like [Papaver somniferum]